MSGGGAPVGAAHLAPGAPAPRRASPSPRGRRPRPPATVPAPSVRSPRRCPPPARVGGRWVSAEKVNEGGGGGSERLTRPGPSTARAPRPPAPWTRRAPRRPSPPPGKWRGGRAACGPGLCSEGTPAPAPRSLGAGAGARALGRARGRGAPSPARGSAAGRGRGLCTLCARVVAQVTVSGRGRSTFRAGVLVCARPFWGPRGRSPPRVRAFLSHLRVIAPGTGRAVGDPTADSSPAADLLGVCPRCSGHRSRGHGMPDTVRSSRGQEQAPGPRRRLGPAVSGALCVGHCPVGFPAIVSPSPAFFSGVPLHGVQRTGWDATGGGDPSFPTKVPACILPARFCWSPDRSGCLLPSPHLVCRDHTPCSGFTRRVPSPVEEKLSCPLTGP